MSTNPNPHNRRGLGMHRHYVPPQAGGSIDARRTADPNPQVPTAQPAQVTGGMPIAQGTLPVGGRGGDRQESS